MFTSSNTIMALTGGCSNICIWVIVMTMPLLAFIHNRLVQKTFLRNFLEILERVSIASCM